MKVDEKWLAERGYDLNGRKRPTLSVVSQKPGNKSKGNKYGAKKSGGYDSKHEHERALHLQVLQQAGKIKCLREQVKYELIPSQRGMDGKVKERAITYIADFVYIDENGREVVEDAKGMKTAVYIMKRKLMRFVHGIVIVEV